MKNITLKKVCIYLDQFAITDLMEANKNSIWFRIRELLFEGYGKNTLFCPLSSEHFLETSRKEYTLAKEHDIFFSKLSDGYCIKPDAFITSQLISSRIRKNNITLKTFMYKNVESVFEQQQNYSEFLNMNKNHKYLIDKSTHVVNEIRKKNNNNKFDKSILDALFQSSKRLSSRKFIDRLIDLEKQKSIKIRGEQIGQKEIPNWIDLIIDILLKKHKLQLNEIRKLIKEFEKFGFDNIATLDIRTTLDAYNAIKNKKLSSNDQLDFMRITTGLPISDIFLTDKQRKFEIIETGLDKKYKTLVFSGKEDDLLKFEETLQTLHIS